MRHAAIALLLLAGQQAAAPPAFDVTSIKANKSGTNQGDQIVSPEEYSQTNRTLRFFIQQAFGGRRDDEIVGGPDWLNTDRWDIRGRANTPGPNMARLRALLEDRFKLVTHLETQTRPVYELVVARADGKLGPQMRPSPEPMRFRPGLTSFIGTGVRMQVLASMLAGPAQRPVIDRTNLSGGYDVDLQWSADSTSDTPSIFTAVQEQLGLKLQPAKAGVDVIVIDHVARPTPD